MSTGRGQRSLALALFLLGRGALAQSSENPSPSPEAEVAPAPDETPQSPAMSEATPSEPSAATTSEGAAPAPPAPTTSSAPAPSSPPAPAVASGSGQELTLQDRSGDVRAMRERPSQVTLSYSTAIALGETRDFVGDFSFAGFGLDWHRRVGEKISVGLSLGWQVLYDKRRGTSVIDSLTVTGVQVHHLNMFPVLLSGRFFPRGSQTRSLRPYLGLGVGAFPAEWRADIGLLSFSSFSAHFGLAPEVGVQIPTRVAGQFCLGVRYNYGFESGGNPEISAFSFTVGLAR